MYGPSERDGTLTQMYEEDRAEVDSVQLIYHEPLDVYQRERELRKNQDWEALAKPIYGKVAYGLMLDNSSDLVDQLLADLGKVTGSDGCIRFRGGSPYLIIRREDLSMRDAILQSIDEICQLMDGYWTFPVTSVEPGDEVNQAEIARRLKRSSESIRLYYQNMRGQGDFPEPLSGRSNRPLVWSWAEVADWATGRLFINHPRLVENAIDIKSINMALYLRDGIGRSIRSSMKSAYQRMGEIDESHRGEDPYSRILAKRNQKLKKSGS